METLQSAPMETLKSPPPETPGSGSNAAERGTHFPAQYETLAGNAQSLTLHPETQPLRSDRAVDTEKSEQEAFLKSIESRIDPQESPTLLVSDPDLIKCENIRVGKHNCPMLDQIALIKKLGEGGNGAVFLGYQRLFGDVAVKTL